MARLGNRIKVIGVDFRIFHIFLMLGSAFLLYSALGADDGDEGAIVISGAWNLFLLHRYIGLLWGTMIVIYAITRASRGKSLHILEPLGKPVMVQIRESFSIMGRYFLGIRISERVRSTMGRHNVMASYAFVMLAFGILFLGAGGIAMVILPQDSAGYEIYLGIHILGAGLLSLFVLAHGFAVINKENRPLLKAVFFNGKVDREWAEESMPAHRLE